MVAVGAGRVGAAPSAAVLALLLSLSTALLFTRESRVRNVTVAVLPFTVEDSPSDVKSICGRGRAEVLERALRCAADRAADGC